MTRSSRDADQTRSARIVESMEGKPMDTGNVSVQLQPAGTSIP